MKTIFYTLTILFLIPAIANSQTFNDSLLLYLPFEGDASDASVWESQVTVYGAKPTTDRFHNPQAAYYFDGVNDYIEVNPNVDLSGICDFAISVWFKMKAWQFQPGIVTGLLDQQYIFDGHAHSSTTSSDFFREGASISVRLPVNRLSYFRNGCFYNLSTIYTTDVLAEVDLLDRWFHNVYTRSGDTTYHYVNGRLIEKHFNDGECMDMNHKLYIGTFSGNNPYYGRINYNFHGKIDDVRFYKRALNEEEVAQLYYGPCATDLIIYDTISVTDTLIIDVDLVNLIPNKRNTIKVYPNPASSFLFVDFGDYNLMDGYRVKIIDLNGRTVFESPIDRPLFTIDVNTFAQFGLYFLQIYDDSNQLIINKKLVLE